MTPPSAFATSSIRNEIVSSPGGSQVLAMDPSGNFVELFQPAAGQ